MYEIMYHILFHAITDAITLLEEHNYQEASRDAEEIYISQ